MTEPPAAPPPLPDPTSDPPPFSAPEAPPYPPYGTEHPAYRPGSARVEPPAYTPPGYTPAEAPVTAVPGYAPVTAVPAYPEIDPRRSRGPVIAAVVGAVALVCGLGGVGGFLLARDSDGERGAATRAESAVSAEPTPPPDSPAPGGRGGTVVYEVSGSGTTIITYAADSGGAPKRVDLPWRTEVTMADRHGLLMVFAFQISGTPLSCRILVDGQEVATDTADGSVACTHVVVD